jgi:hypothetical protein
MTPNISTFFNLEEQDTDMQVELGDDVRYPMVDWGLSHSAC